MNFKLWKFAHSKHVHNSSLRVAGNHNSVFAFVVRRVHLGNLFVPFIGSMLGTRLLLSMF